RLLPPCAAAALALLTFLPEAGADVHVTRPDSGGHASYRQAVIEWEPTPGATTYHLQIDDDPGFASPEVDVTVAEPRYRLDGQTLRLNGQGTWPAYVRINGERWDAHSFAVGIMPENFGAYIDVAGDANGGARFIGD